MTFVLELRDVEGTQVAAVGGKGAALGELARIDGVSVPAGFGVTTTAFRHFTAFAGVDERIERLARMEPDDRDAIRRLSLELRESLCTTPIPEEVAAAITRPLGDGAYAVRSSATAEDLPDASFAGQHDSYLNVTGAPAVLERVRRCWASLFTERAVTYRLRHGFDHRAVAMAVVVQQMVPAEAAGVLFTADPATSNRKVAAVEAVPGLADDLVSGRADPDHFTLRDGKVVTATDSRTLTDAQVVRLAQLGRRIEAHFDHPQDIEWCLAGDGFHIVQSRPITTLFPIPPADDGANHIYISVGHQQMMTDPMKPLGLSVWQMTTPRPMAEAGGRLFVDVARELGAPATREPFLAMIERSDPLIADALTTVLERGDFIPERADEAAGPMPPAAAQVPVDADLADPAELIADTRAAIAAVEQTLQAASGVAVLDTIRTDLDVYKHRHSDPRSLQLILAAMQAAWWINDRMREWLGETNAADVLTRSVPHNITSEMGLDLIDVADAIRPHPDVVAFLERADDEGFDDARFLEALSDLEGGGEARDAIQAYLDTYGMRCVGEIDITRPRWSEQPTALLPTLLSNLRNFEPGAAARRRAQGQRDADAKQRELLARLRELPDGEDKAGQAEVMIGRVRTLAGYREYPKYAIVSRYLIYKRALLAEADRLVRAGVLDQRDDVFYLRFEELDEVMRTQRVDDQRISSRRKAFARYQTLTPPRVLTSDGEVLAGDYRREDLPAGALIGLPVSVGTVEGRARVILDIADAALEPGDILVTRFTDPSWTPAFLAVGGLVTEVGGHMTHGAVIAREYGLPAVIGVQNATTEISDGEWIRVHGSEGYVEILAEEHTDRGRGVRL